MRRGMGQELGGQEGGGEGTVWEVKGEGTGTEGEGEGTGTVGEGEGAGTGRDCMGLEGVEAPAVHTQASSSGWSWGGWACILRTTATPVLD